MKLSVYLADNTLSDADFAAAIGVERQAVHRYRTGQRVPTRAILANIFEATGGLVTANDFFDQAEPEQVATSEAGEAA